jgi:hypothetical protein
MFLLPLLIVAAFLAVPAQSRLEAIEKLNNLKQEAESLEKIVMAPVKEDVSAAEKENANVFRLLPRETYDKGLLNTRGGGAYYSFVKRSHSYNDTPQIELQQNNLSVGFYGASYGFITNLGDIPLSEINLDTAGVTFLANYQAVGKEPLARQEHSKIGTGLEVEGTTYKSNVPAAVGKTYVLRAISFDEADTLVAFRVYRKDTDGSLIIFWKLLQNFEKPVLARNE